LIRISDHEWWDDSKRLHEFGAYAVPRIVEAHGWPWAFCGVSIGPALGILAIRRMRR
jgi:hypothetical protein